MRTSGVPETDVRRRIATDMADDVPWNRVLNSICTEPHPLGVEMAAAAAHTNLGDVRIFRGTKRIERKVVQLLLDLLGHPGGGSGSLVSGGTEANLIAMLVARETARARGTLTDRPEVVVSSTVHFSFTKVFGLLGLTPVVVPVDDDLRLPAAEVARRIGEHTVAVVATAGSSEFGVVDAVDEIGPVVRGRNVHLHVDAATGGFIIPFARELGHDLPQFDFSVDGVDSITIDPHKYGLANVPAGAILFRGAQDAGRFAVDSFFVDTPVHNTLLGTRPGSAAISTYAVLEHLGRDGFCSLTRTNFEVTAHLVAGLRAAGHELAAEPQLNIVVVKMEHAVRISQLLESWGWIVSTSKRFGETLRLVVTRHVTREMVDEFLPVLERARREVAAEAALR
ncbi:MULTISPECIES: tyrosine decarboxylase MfnA [Streptomyces]|jgi:tyrosine decarboxylase/tyrosine decarboxylase/aspartate 1-decarboxylase|uniref:Tyrosine decarboxylase MfnA n=1 Tax=Streptomyces spinosisporus TaxID=2927582 RepID=A0ABS9XDE0_9ACTN|nr:tyrosine decarboxylase MfnA [Streptomyces spinosisporus]MCI3240080.1 tyrosine decarboxylase MfnA [Streptomyces spinosisporus]